MLTVGFILLLCPVRKFLFFHNYHVISYNVIDESLVFFCVGVGVCFSGLVKTQTDFQSNDNLVFVNVGDSVNITCHYQSEMAMHYSWYKHKLGQKPKLISNFYKYDKKATFHHEFKENARFNMVNKKGVTHLEIKEIELSDSATYYCGSAHSNIVEFGEGTELVVQGNDGVNSCLMHLQIF